MKKELSGKCNLSKNNLEYFGFLFVRVIESLCRLCHDTSTSFSVRVTFMYQRTISLLYCRVVEQSIFIINECLLAPSSNIKKDQNQEIS